ncbi:MAG: SDR family oxidoreductase [Stenomitos rutilans HA7619-LM2]|jgi:NAD(P)-dependent dehydrogenase (short-subunit alcohol dehydrogenase family)|nr:SDR family oxidoreductase [Stenomitos rutilans HA7619-LM2]
MEIKGSVALVSGANKGIGKEFVKALHDMEADRIYACARDESKLSEVVALDPQRIIPLALDITSEPSIQAAVERCQDVTLLINNAGVGYDAGLIAAPDLSHARKEMETNYFGTLIMCRAIAPLLKQNGGGAIVNTLSSLALSNLPFRGSYSASKAAALSMTQGIRAELAAQGTLVVAMLPGTVDTDFSKNSDNPKTAPDTVANAALQAVIDGVEEVYPGDEAQWAIDLLNRDRKALEKQMAQQLPRS